MSLPEAAHKVAVKHSILNLGQPIWDIVRYILECLHDFMVGSLEANYVYRSHFLKNNEIWLSSFC